MAELSSIIIIITLPSMLSDYNKLIFYLLL